MKTFEEALKAEISMQSGEDMSLRVHNAEELTREIAGSKTAVEYLGSLVQLGISEDVNNRSDDDYDAAKYFSFLMSMSMTAFAVGVRVGMQMEKQEIPEEGIKAS